MTSPHIDRLRQASSPRVLISQWTSAEGWPCWRVYLHAVAFGFEGEGSEHYLEFESFTEAQAAAGVLAKATGWPIHRPAYPGRN